MATPGAAGRRDVTLMLAGFLLLIVMGAPIVLALGASAALAIYLADIPAGIIAQRMYGGLDSFTVMAIPFFVLTGIIMERGGIARRIIDFSVALVGWITGSLLLVATVAGIGMAAVSGSGAASTAAISSIMLREMRRRGYDIDFSAGLMAAAGTLGPVIPPSIMMVVLATTSNLSVGRAFLGGVVPGLLMGLAIMLSCYVYARRGGDAYRRTEPFSLRRLARTFVAAIPAFSLPVIIVGGIIGGLFTPTEAAAVAAFVGVLIALFVYREITPGSLPGMILRAAAVSASIMTIIATASIFSWLIAVENLPQDIAAFLHAATGHPLVFLLLMNLLLIVVGMFMEGISAILVLVPVLLPVAVSFGIDPLHFGVVVILNLSIGMITPPYGITLYVASGVAQRTVLQVSRKIGMPFLLMIAVLILATLLPETITLLPDLLMPPTAGG
jgi:C4-dicarboxylate transporter DctM subunit